MPIDTSSYYPEVNGPDGKDDSWRLNDRHKDLFGSKPEENQKGDTEVAPEEKRGGRLEPPPYEHKPHGKNSKDHEESDMEKGVSLFSNFLSWVLVPLLMPVYGIMLAFGLSVLELVPFGMRVNFTLIVAGINFVIPVLLVLLLKFLGVVDDVGLNGRKERLIPYMITVICIGVTAWFLAMKGAPLWLCMFFAGGAAAGIVNLLINLKWKISAHAAAIAGVVAMLIRMERETATEPVLFTWLIITVGLAGLLGSARIWLGRHTMWQVLAGYAVGFCCVFFLMGIR